jgi:hypothetical protein
MSGTLRRLLVHRDITKVAAPRIGKVLFQAHDFSHHYRTARREPVLALVCGDVHISGQHFGSMTLFRYKAADLIPPGATEPSHDEFMRRVGPEGNSAEAPPLELRLDPFLNQQVLFLEGVWVSRRVLIKYLANIASGVHTDDPTTAEEIAIARLRRNFAVAYRDGQFHLDLPDQPHDLKKMDFKPRSDALDPAFIQLLETADCVVNSPDVIQLEKLVVAELS